LAAGHLLVETGGEEPSRRAAADHGAEPRTIAPMMATRGNSALPDELAAIADLPKLSLEGRPMAAPTDPDGAVPTVRTEENAS
jgi:hypothetical protein